MEYESCYVYKSDTQRVSSERASKRRKIGGSEGLHASWPRRQQLYNQLWSEHKLRLQTALNELNERIISDVAKHILNVTPGERDAKIKAAILVTGPSIVSQNQLTEKIKEAVTLQSRSCFVDFSAGEAPNLKAVLKRVNAAALSTDIDAGDAGDDEDDENVVSNLKGVKLLNYDLRILQNYVEDTSLDHVVVAFHDCEALDGTILTDVIELFSHWTDRIPFVLLFGVATSVDALQARLGRRAVRCLRGRRFDVTKAEITIENVFSRIHDLGSKLFCGSGLSQLILARQRDFIVDPQSMVDSIQYTYMTHLYADALSIFLDRSAGFGDIPKDHFNAVRRLPSFQHLIQTSLDEGRMAAQEVRALLDSDQKLFEYISMEVVRGQTLLQDMIEVARLYRSLRVTIELEEPIAESDIVIQALAGSLSDSPRMRSFFLVLKRATSVVLARLLKESSFLRRASRFQPFLKRLTELLDKQDDPNTPLRSEVDIQNSTLRTTVISKKISLSKAKTSLTEADAAYSKILDDFIDELKRLFDEALIDPKTLPFHEIFIFDLKSPFRQTFTPRPRHAIERALSSPHDYLNCDCCAPSTEDDAASHLSSTQPPTAILYQLYLESGMMLNAVDLRSAFQAILGEVVDNEEVLSSLFQRSLAELSYLGLVRGTKKKADHLLKLSWKGL